MQGQLASAYQIPEGVARARRAPPRADDGSVESTVLWRILWHRRRWIALCSLAATVAALLFCLLAPAQFVATAQIIVDPRDKQVVSNDIYSTSIAPDGGIAQVESQVSVVQSNSVLLRAIVATSLETDPEYNGSGAVSRIIDLLGAVFTSAGPGDIDGNLKAKTLAALRKKLTVKRADKVLVIDVSVGSHDADKAARLANAVADAYLAEQAQAHADAGREASKALSARLTELQDRVRDAENAVEVYRTQTKRVVSTGQLVSDQQLNELTAQLSAAQSRVAALKAQLDQQRRNRPSADGTTEAMQSPVVTQLRSREGALVEKLADLSRQLGPLHPEYISAEAELRNVRALILKEIDRLGRATQVDYERALADERGLANQLDQLKSQSLDNDKTDVRLHQLQREAEAVRSVYSAFLTRAKETSEQADVDTTNARIISRALRPQQRSWPPTALLLIGAAFAGLGLGASGSLTHEYLAPLVMSARQIGAIAQAPVIGILPVSGASSFAPFKRDKAEANRAQDLETRDGFVDPVSNRIVQLFLTNLLARGSGSRRRYAARCLLVTSCADDAVERARVAELIASVAARNGENVLFVDADIAEDKHTKTPGFRELLRNECTIDAVARLSSRGGYLRIDKGRLDRDARLARRGELRLPRGESEAWQLTRALRFFDLTVIDVGALPENYRAAALAGAADERLLIAEIAATRQTAVTEVVEAAELMGMPLSSVMLVDKSSRA